MKRIREKLKSGRGASMVFALLVFLLCVLAGTAALTAASSNIGRYTHLEDEQRQYFSVASALKVLEGKVDGYTPPITVEVQCVETETWKYETNAATGALELQKSTEKEYSIVSPTGIGSSNVPHFLFYMMKNNLPADWWTGLNDPTPLVETPWTDKEYKVELETPVGDPDWAKSIYPVSVKVSAGTDDGALNLIMFLTTDDGAYPLRVEWPGKVKSEMTNVSTTTSGTANEGSRVTTTKITLTLTWSGADRKIQLGETS